VANPYRALFAIPGVKVFVAAGFIGRMPMSMTTIAIVLLVSARTGSYGLAGTASAACAFAYGAAAPVVGRLVDRYDQGRVLTPLVVAHAGCVVTLIALARPHTGIRTLLPASVAVGLTLPSLAALVRARWAHLVDADRLHVAYAFESVADEVIYITSPVVVTLLATVVHPAAGVAVSGALTLAGGLALAVQRGTQPPPRAVASSGSAITVPVMRVLVPVFVLTGSAFGAIEVSIVAYAQEHGHRAASGLLLAVFAVGSMIAGFWYGTRNWRSDLDRRFTVGLVLFAAGLTPLPFVPGIVSLVPLMFLAGLASSSTVIPCYGLIQRLVPTHLLTEGLPWVSTAVGTGVAVGAPIAGSLVDGYGAGRALMYPFAAVWGAAAVALAGRRLMRPVGLPEATRT
jgi:MFS family permease